MACRQTSNAGFTRATRSFCQGKLSFPGKIKNLAGEKAFHVFLRSLFRQDWVVYAKRPFGGPEHVLHYLARYTHRVAISNHRIVNFADGQVSFRWKDYAHKGKQRKMTLTAEEFLRRFLLHVLPPRFVRIRFFGFLANCRRKENLPLCQRLLQTSRQPSSPAATAAEGKLAGAGRCPHCGAAMVIVERLTAQQIYWRSIGSESFIDTS